MQVENHKEEVPFSHYEGLFRSLDPAEAQKRLPSVRFSDGTFALTLLGREYRISWPEYAIVPADGGTVPPLPEQTFLLRCLLEGKETAFGGRMLTFREMPWGELYSKPFAGRVLTRAAFTFGTRLEAFRQAGERLGLVPLKHGDAAFQADFFGPYTMQIIVWAGDEEFPPNAQVLYSDNFVSGFAAEDRVVAGDLLVNRLKSAMASR